MTLWPGSRSTLLAVAVTCTLQPGPGSLHAQTTGTWSTGLRTEYAWVGDGQFTNLGDGIGANAFLRRSLDARRFLEIGASVTRHVFYFLCFWSPCEDGHTTVVGLYGQAALSPAGPGPSVTPYAGPRLGVLFGNFQDGGAGLDAAAVGGLIVPTGSRFSFDLGAAASMVFVGKPPPQASRHAWDWRIALRIGLVANLR